MSQVDVVRTDQPYLPRVSADCEKSRCPIQMIITTTSRPNRAVAPRKTRSAIPLHREVASGRYPGPGSVTKVAMVWTDELGPIGLICLIGPIKLLRVLLARGAHLG